MVRMHGKIGGYGTPGFILVMAVVACNMIGKATWIGLGFSAMDNVAVVWMWVLTCILPQLLLVKSQNNCLFKRIPTLKNKPLFFRPLLCGL